MYLLYLDVLPRLLTLVSCLSSASRASVRTASTSSSSCLCLCPPSVFANSPIISIQTVALVSDDIEEKCKN